MIDPTHDPRVAGQITRYHTWPRTRDQSVGEHTWQVMRILLAVWPECPRRLLTHAMFHDVGEMAGDIPYPFKRNDPVLKDRMDAAEAGVRAEMAVWGVPPTVVMSHYEERVFKTCEFIDMWECGLHEMNLGNKYGQVVAMRCILAASALSDSLEPPPGQPDLRPAIRRYVDKRQQQETT